MGATPTYLFRRRNGIYYFRTRIPRDLQPHFARSEISRSLETRDPSAAIRLARMYIVQLQTAFDSIRNIHMRQRTELITISRKVQSGKTVAASSVPHSILTGCSTRLMYTAAPVNSPHDRIVIICKNSSIACDIPDTQSSSAGQSRSC
jgi:hypothetical protein